MEQKPQNSTSVKSPLQGRFRGGLNIFLTAMMFYTRIPIKWNIQYSSENLNKATRYFPLVGLIVGGIGAFVFWGASFILPQIVAVILSTAATIYVTGSFHEDGFADFCDGFGGGYTPEKIITIMKDSRIGTYGAVALMLLLATKITSINSASLSNIPLLIIMAHGLSRVMPVLVIFTANYVRDDITSKIKPIGKKGNTTDLISAIFFGTIMLFIFDWNFIVTVIPILLIVTFTFRQYIMKKIGGYTGDCLGALQQICEVVIYLTFIAIA